jgi:hypothetical protein
MKGYSMKFDKNDLTQADNLIKALRKGKFELEGMEVLALAQAMGWLGRFAENIRQDLSKPAIEVKPEKTPIQEPPASPAEVSSPTSMKKDEKKRGK